MTKEEIKRLHSHTLRNRKEIEASDNCVCISCCEIFHASKVEDYIDKGETALCPICGIDAVIGDCTGISMDSATLKELHKEFF